MKRDFLKLGDLSASEHRFLFDRAAQLKNRRRQRLLDTTLAGRTLALIFEKASTRTRLSFEAAALQLGGHAIDLPPGTSQLGRGEPLADTARIVGSYSDAVVMRTFADERLAEFARACPVPVINGLTDGAHPVQLLADLFTVEERLGGVKGRKVAFIGDGAANMARSFVEAAGLFDFELRLACPERYRPPRDEVEAAGGRVLITGSPSEAARGADVLVTDVWTSMGQEAETEARKLAFQGFCVTSALLALAQPRAIVLHCLPAHRGEEITADVLEGPQSAVWDEAENRLHVQKALLELLLT